MAFKSISNLIIIINSKAIFSFLMYLLLIYPLCLFWVPLFHLFYHLFLFLLLFSSITPLYLLGIYIFHSTLLFLLLLLYLLIIINHILILFYNSKIYYALLKNEHTHLHIDFIQAIFQPNLLIICQYHYLND